MTGGYSLLITLVSSTSLAKVRLQNPLGDAADSVLVGRRRPYRVAHAHRRDPRLGVGLV